jgi:hypothetical protein
MNNATTTVNMQIGIALSSIAESQKKMVETTEKMMKVLGLIISSDAIKKSIGDDEDVNKLLDDITTIINE